MNDKQDYLIKKKNLNNFLTSNSGAVVDGRYDEPTYLTFRVEFFSDVHEYVEEEKEGEITIKKELKTISYNDMPEALLSDSDKLYSTKQYLREVLGDNFRADLMNTFLNLIKDLNDTCSYYIKSIEGLDKILEVSAKRGSRIKKDTAITFKCFEGLDQRITTLKTLYKKIAWDDEYQRWILPDIMRYFRMNIYISEFRIFHEDRDKDKKNFVNTITGELPTESKLSTINTIKNTLSSVGNVFKVGSNSEIAPFVLTNAYINKVIPTTIITCKMCEFDIDNNYKIYSSLDRSNPKSRMVDDVELKVKVGNIEEVIYNGSFKGNNNTVYITDNNLKNTYEGDNMIAYYNQNKEKRYYTIDIYDKRTGIIGITDTPQETSNLNDSTGAGSLGFLGNAIKDAVKGAVAWADNKANDYLNNALNKKMGNGLSFNDMASAITSGSITNMFNTFKTKANAVSELYPEISKATTSDVALESFKSFVEEVAKNKSDIINSQIAKELLEYGDRINASSIDEYMDIISAATNEIYNDIINRNLADLPENYSTATAENDLSINIDQPKDYSSATNQDINTKILL